MNNYLLEDIQHYFEEIVYIRKRLITTASFLQTRATQLLEEDYSEDRQLFSGLTDYRDLTLVQAQDNLFLPNFSYNIRKKHLPQELESMISEYSCYAVAQAYEVFETFLLDTLSNYFTHNPTSIVLLKKYAAPADGRDAIRLALRRNQESNNRGLLTIIRQLSTYFTQYENNNIHNLNISEWFDLLSAVRHNLVHSRQAFTPRLQQYIRDKNHHDHFAQHFSTRNFGNKEVIFLSQEQALDIISWLSSFSHLVFKSLCQQAQLNPAIPEYNPAYPC